MIPPAFITSTIQLPANAVKSILFTVSALLVQLAVSNFFSLIAFRSDAFTSYLIFSEPLPQQLIYILRRRSFLVLSFLVLFTAGGLWATMLWGLDHPGFLFHPHRVTVDTLANHRRLGPPYAIMSQSPPGNVSALNLVADLGTGLFEGINATLTDQVAAGHPQIAQTPKWKPYDDGDTSLTAGSQFPGARIFLDDQGWSVGIDPLAQTVESWDKCASTYLSVMDTNWACEIDYRNNTRIGADYFQSPFAIPYMWWSAMNGVVDAVTITAERGSNPWDSLGTGGDTAMMKMVFSASRGNRKHTFMVSAIKSTLMAFGNAQIQMADVRDLVKRTWRAGESSELQTQDVDAIVAAVGIPYTGLVLGRQHSDGYKVTTRNYQLQSIMVGDTTVYTVFQILDANITLINSETVPQAPTPFEHCDTWYQNVAYGGVLAGSDCALALRGDGKTGVFQGETDTMGVFVLTGTLNNRRATTSADALNGDAWRWTQDNNNAIEALVLSRAYIIAGNLRLVAVDVGVLRPAVSIVQLILVLLPVLVFFVSWGVVLGWVESHFQSSLFSNLVATTHDGYNGARPKYMHDPPKLGIKRGVDGRVYVGTETGVFWHTGRASALEEATGMQQKGVEATM